jgi:hypothetical protein
MAQGRTLLRAGQVDQVTDTDEVPNRRIELAPRRQAAKKGPEKATGEPDLLTSFL